MYFRLKLSQILFVDSMTRPHSTPPSQVSTFAINYRGHPFMESLTENRSLLYSLAGAGGFVVMLALGWLPEFSDQFSIVDFSDEFRSILLQVIPCISQDGFFVNLDTCKPIPSDTVAQIVPLARFLNEPYYSYHGPCLWKWRNDFMRGIPVSTCCPKRLTFVAT